MESRRRKSQRRRGLSWLLREGFSSAPVAMSAHASLTSPDLSPRTCTLAFESVRKVCTASVGRALANRRTALSAASGSSMAT